MDGDGWVDAIHAAWWAERNPKTSRHDIIRDPTSPTGLDVRGTSITLGPGTVNSVATHGRVATFTSPASPIVTTESGLQYRDVVVGTGAKPSGPAAAVVVNYEGWLLDGTEVDQGRAASFTLNDTIRGWEEGLASMRVGGRRQLIIPADLAYGSEGTANIPPGSTLVFDIELLSTT
jgi:peptidylprolyl isomerase